MKHRQFKAIEALSSQPPARGSSASYLAAMHCTPHGLTAASTICHLEAEEASKQYWNVAVTEEAV
jgi:hypothetical protein